MEAFSLPRIYFAKEASIVKGIQLKKFKPSKVTNNRSGVERCSKYQVNNFFAKPQDNKMRKVWN